MTPLKPGSVFGGAYEIVRPISAGGMGFVYEVIHRQTMRRRALKVMLGHIIDDPIMRARFSQEAVVAAGVRSEHITEIFDAGIDAESTCPYLVMELLEGEDLGARLKRGERYTLEETVEFLAQTARALAKTHEQGIIHRDLKPDNLFLTQRDDGSPRVKILDFGIAKVVKRSGTGAQATTNALGTPYYMAREQITGESRLIGPECNLYALAHIAYAMLVGVPYFQDEGHSSDGNILAVLMAVGIGAREPATARAARRGVVLPAGFDAWFARGTALMPKDRFGDAPEMIEALWMALGEPARVIPAAPSSRSGANQLIPSNRFPAGPSLSFSSHPLPAASQSFPSNPFPAGASQSFPQDPFQSGGHPSFASPPSQSVPLGGPASVPFGAPASAQQTNSPQEIKNARAAGSPKRSWLFAAVLSVGVAGALAFGAWRMSLRDAGGNTVTARGGSAESAAPQTAASASAAAAKTGEQEASARAEETSHPAAPAPRESAAAASATPIAPQRAAPPVAAVGASPPATPTPPMPTAAAPPPQQPGVSGFAGTKGPWENHL